MPEIKKLSIAIPVYNEEGVVEELLRRVCSLLDSLPQGPHELVVVDDGSSDRTAELLIAAAGADPRIRVVLLSRNFGQQPAYAAALEHVSGDAVVLMDGDLQDSPEDIPLLVKTYEEGYDVVYAVRVKRKEGSLKRLSYALYYRLLRWISATPLPRDAGDFSLISRRVADLLAKDADRHRYLRGVRSWVGFKQTGVEVERDARSAGETKYTPRLLFRLAFDGVFAFSLIPLRLAIMSGLLAVGIALLLAILAIAARLSDPASLPDFISDIPPGFTALTVAITFFAGVQLVFLGVIGEYIGRIFEEVKHRPPYIVDRVV